MNKSLLDIRRETVEEKIKRLELELEGIRDEESVRVRMKGPTI